MPDAEPQEPASLIIYTFVVKLMVNIATGKTNMDSLTQAKALDSLRLIKNCDAAVCAAYDLEKFYKAHWFYDFVNDAFLEDDGLIFREMESQLLIK